MKIKSIWSACFLLASVTLSSTFVQAANDSNRDYEEVSYDDLLTELSSKKASIKKEATSPFDDVRIHAGLGYVNSFSTFRVNNENMNRYQNGLQLSAGIDLFSPNWLAEGIFRNYGVTSDGSEDISLKEFDLRIAYQQPLNSIWSYSLGTGLANRFLKISDSARGISIDDTTPALLMGGGFYANPTKNLSIGVELNAHSPFVNSTADKNSYDLAFRISTSL